MCEVHWVPGRSYCVPKFIADIWAAERITYKATLDKRILVKGGVQKKLDALAHLPEFSEIVIKEAAKRGLVFQDILHCAKNLYHEVSKNAHGNDGTILVISQDYTSNKNAALVAYLKLQDNWTYPLIWTEKKEKKEMVEDEGY